MKRAQEELETIINRLAVIRQDFEEIDEGTQQVSMDCTNAAFVV